MKVSSKLPLQALLIVLLGGLKGPPGFHHVFIYLLHFISLSFGLKPICRKTTFCGGFDQSNLKTSRRLFSQTLQKECLLVLYSSVFYYIILFHLCHLFSYAEINRHHPIATNILKLCYCCFASFTSFGNSKFWTYDKNFAFPTYVLTQKCQKTDIKNVSNIRLQSDGFGVDYFMSKLFSFGNSKFWTHGQNSAFPAFVLTNNCRKNDKKIVQNSRLKSDGFKVKYFKSKSPDPRASLCNRRSIIRKFVVSLMLSSNGSKVLWYNKLQSPKCLTSTSTLKVKGSKCIINGYLLRNGSTCNITSVLLFYLLSTTLWMPKIGSSIQVSTYFNSSKYEITHGKNHTPIIPIKPLLATVYGKAEFKLKLKPNYDFATCKMRNAQFEIKCIETYGFWRHLKHTLLFFYIGFNACALSNPYENLQIIISIWNRCFCIFIRINYFKIETKGHKRKPFGIETPNKEEVK